MRKEDFQRLSSWFNGYVEQAFDRCGSEEVSLKHQHSMRVARNCRLLAEQIKWQESDIWLSEAIGLLHDVGRFLQLQKYDSMDDLSTEDHGELGWKILHEVGVLEILEKPSQEKLLTAVRYHNRRHIPEGLNQEQLKFLQLIRDSDKLDIYTVFTTEMRRDGAAIIKRLWPGLSSGYQITPELLEQYLANRDCSYTQVRTLADFFLVFFSWAYLLNYQASYRLLYDRKALEEVIEFLPPNPELKKLADQAISYIAIQAS